MQAPVPNAVCVSVSVSAQRIHASSATYLALMKDCVYELHLRGETDVKVRLFGNRANLIIVSLGKPNYPILFFIYIYIYMCIYILLFGEMSSFSH